MAARKNKANKDNPMPKEWRDKIRATLIAHRMFDCFNGTVELTAAQLKAGEILFKRLEPELSRAEVGGIGGQPIKAELDVTVSPADSYKRMLGD